jgi:hypothetical protein
MRRSRVRQSRGGPAIHHLRCGNKYSAEHYFKQILYNDDRPRTMHAEAERTERDPLPEVVAEVIERHAARRRAPPHRLAGSGEGGAGVARRTTNGCPGSRANRGHGTRSAPTTHDSSARLLAPPGVRRRPIAR